MFTGIITDIGTIISIENNGDLRAVIQTHYDMSGVAIGASISCSGVCLTVVEKEIQVQSEKEETLLATNSFTVEISAETISRTNISQWEEGSEINLERALRMGDELGGHLVSGHVDGVAVVESIKKIDDSHCIVFIAPEKLAMFIAEKGSITLDGISLTVNEVDRNSFKVNIIPHTWENTTISNLLVGSKVNLEIDMLARYIARMQEYKNIVR